jgi:hypothetical protein
MDAIEKLKGLVRRRDRLIDLLGQFRGHLQQAADAMQRKALVSAGESVDVDALGASQERLTEALKRITEGIHQLDQEILQTRAELSGMQIVFVPDGAVEAVERAISDHEIAQRIGTKSQYDELYDEAAAAESDPNPKPF